MDNRVLRLDIARAVTPRGVIAPASILVADGRISAVDGPARIGATPAATVERALSTTAVPGFIDLQINGAVGHSFGRAGSWSATAAFLLATGTTACTPTLVSQPLPDYVGALATLADVADEAAPRLIGVHLEGPFLAAGQRGAHPVGALVAPDAEWALRLVETSPVPIAIWTLAPELPGALELVAALAAAGVQVSAGHSDATAEQMRAARDAGLSLVTHLFNAQRGVHHREPGVVGAALVLDGLRAGLILDGRHVHPDVVTIVLRTAAERIFAVTDAIAAVGLPRGVHTIDGITVDTSDGAPLLPDGTLAGSVLTMDAAFRAAHDASDLVTAVALTATTPAAALGRTDLGALEAGRCADIVLLDERLEVERVLVAGATVQRRA